MTWTGGITMKLVVVLALACSLPRCVGKGIQHGEMFPLVNSDKPNTMRLHQIWLNLPKKAKMTEPGFIMHWAEKGVSEVCELYDDSSKNVIRITPICAQTFPFVVQCP